MKNIINTNKRYNEKRTIKLLTDDNIVRRINSKTTIIKNINLLESPNYKNIITVEEKLSNNATIMDGFLKKFG